MKSDSEESCHCPCDTAVILQGSLPTSPLNCIQCRNSVSLDDTNVPKALADNIYKWARIYSTLISFWHDNTNHQDGARQRLLDETDTINLDGLELAQQHNVIRKTYYWMFQDYRDKDYVQPLLCPFCGASMEPIMKNDFKVCHPCMVAYPDKQTS